MLQAAESRVLEGSRERLEYSLRRTGRRRTVGIIVEPDRQVLVLAPATATAEKVDQIVRRRLPWIRRQRRAIEAIPPPAPPRQWVAGETHRYLGRQYRLKIAKGKPGTVRLVGAYFIVTVPDPGNRTAVRRAMEAWYREHAEPLLRDRVNRLLAATTWLEVPEPPIRLQALRQRWGSTTPQGRITFNSDLIKLPLPCIDYVVAHELVHLVIPNHGPAFWRMLGRLMPDWERWRGRLKMVEV